MKAAAGGSASASAPTDAFAASATWNGSGSKALALLLAGTCLLSGCISGEDRAADQRALVTAGMTRDEVRAAVGPPDDSVPVPGEPSSPSAAVELWHYSYRYTFWSYMAMIFLFPFGWALVKHKPYSFDVLFGTSGRVVRTSAVREGK